MRRLASLVLLALASAIPGVGLVAFGCVLDMEGRIARGERPRAALPSLDVAGRVLAILVSFAVAIGLLRLLSDAAYDASLIEPGRGDGLRTLSWVYGATIIATGGFGLHRAHGWISTMAAHEALRRWLWLGVLGVACSVVWLALPAALLVAAQTFDGGGLLALLGLLLLLPILSRLPFIQAHVAVEGTAASILWWRCPRGRISAWRRAGDFARRAPLAHAAAILACFVLATPVHLAMVVPLPPDARWLLALLIVPFALLSRTMVALAYRRSAAREIAARPWRWLARPVIISATVFYATVLFFVPRVAADGSMTSLFSPMFGL